MNKPALMILDMQVGNFTEPDPIFEKKRLLSKIKKLIARARSAGVLIVYIQNNGSDDDPDTYGTPGWEIHPYIGPHKGDLVVQKQIPDAFHETNLLSELTSRKIQNLVIAGLQTEYCIDTTCRRAFSLGYDVILVEDAHSTWESQLFSARQIIDHHNHILNGVFVTLRNEKEIEF
ncbi:MAG: cysteine hydrolase family protein [Candidatus Hodarchaeales archaeon]|jgi:nicotinamidase-related amidase